MNQDQAWTATLRLDRSGSTSLVEQLRTLLADAIVDGTIAPGSRLPSWRDLASQLGVARGTVRQAYDDLVDANLIVTAGAKGTRVSDQPPRQRATTQPHVRAESGFPFFAVEPLPLQVGVPSQVGFPHALWTRLSREATQRVMGRSIGYPDPCGEADLRLEIAKHLRPTRRGSGATSGACCLEAPRTQNHCAQRKSNPPTAFTPLPASGVERRARRPGSKD